MLVVILAALDWPFAALVGVADAEEGVSVSVTGQTVVERMMVSVVTLPIRAGQSVTVAAQEVIV